MDKTTADKIFKIIKEKLNLKDFDFDIFLIKKLAQSNTLSESNSNQTHIAITGNQIDVFPYLENYGHLVLGDSDFKKRFILRIPVLLSPNNLNYLDNRNLVSEDSYIETYTHFNRSKRGDDFQGELSYLKGEDDDFIEKFRKKLDVNDYIIVAKQRGVFRYLFLGIKNSDMSGIIGDLTGNIEDTAQRQKEVRKLSSDVFYDTVNAGTGKNVTLVDEKCIISEEIAEYSMIQKPQYPYQRIVYGAPGTGKSYKIQDDLKNYFRQISATEEEVLLKQKEQTETVTFYPDYSYGKFVGMYKPVTREGNVIYEFQKGPFLNILIKALQNHQKNYFLVIEEINRANAAAVFGDIFQLLDRDLSGVSQYDVSVSEDVKKVLQEYGIDEEKIKLPANLYIWATMNTSDQGIFILDSAFKRRWHMEYLDIDEGESVIENIEVYLEFSEEGIKRFRYNEFRKALNKTLTEDIDGIKEDKLIGPFYIKPDDLKVGKFEDIFYDRLLMYLCEDVVRHNKAQLFDPAFKSFGKIKSGFLMRNIFAEGTSIYEFLKNTEKGNEKQ